MSQTRAQLVKGFSNTSASDDAVTVDSNGNVGIGVTPSSWGGSRNAIQFDSAGAAYVCNDTTVGIVSNMYFDGSNNKYINAGTASSAYFQQDNVVFQFAPSGSADGNGTFTTSTRIDADGIKFGSDTAAANALDDYEEGTFTGSFNNSDNDATVSHGNQTGYYVKVGSLVHFSLYFDDIDVSATGSTTNARIYGLPFTSLGSNQHYSVVNIIHNTILTSAAGAYVNTNQTHMIPTNVGTTTTSTFSTGTNFRLMIGGTYRAA
tara:strand:+ start:9507 stop:10292 length:786 start_codon:yes stop_codon:yes gene_type:complete